MPVDSSKLPLYIGGGLIVIAIVALLAKNSSTTTGSSPSDTAAIQGIVTSNVNAQNTQAAVASQYLAGATAIEKEILDTTAAVKINTQNNAAAVSINNTNATTALDETQIQSAALQQITSLNDATQKSIASTNANAAESIQNTISANQTTQAQAAAGAQKTSSIGGIIGNILQSIPLIGGLFSMPGGSGVYNDANTLNPNPIVGTVTP